MIGLGLSLWRRGGGTPGNSAEVQQFFDRLVTLPSASRQTLYASLINGLVSDGVWTLLDALYLYAAADSDTSLTNLKQTAFKATLDTASGNPAFTVDRGWANAGAGGVRGVNTNFNPATAGGNYTQNSAMISAWQIGSTQESRPIIVNVSGDSKIEVYPLYGDGKTYWAINGSGTEVGPTLGLGDPSGFWLVQRTGANAQELNRNGTQVSTSANASAALSSSKIIPSNLLNNVAQMAIGASLTAGQKTAIYTRVQTYLTAVGAV